MLGSKTTGGEMGKVLDDDTNMISLIKQRSIQLEISFKKWVKTPIKNVSPTNRNFTSVF